MNHEKEKQHKWHRTHRDEWNKYQREWWTGYYAKHKKEFSAQRLRHYYFRKECKALMNCLLDDFPVL